MEDYTAMKNTRTTALLISLVKCPNQSGLKKRSQRRAMKSRNTQNQTIYCLVSMSQYK